MRDDFWKYEGLGNDYLVVEPELLGAEPRPAQVRALCDRHHGPGSDGLLVGRRCGEGWELRIFNPDGSEAEKSGNGLRIFARHIFETDPLHPSSLAIQTKGGRVDAEILAPDGSLVSVDMGPPRFDAESLAASHGLAPGRPGEPGEPAFLDRPGRLGSWACTLSLVSMGNPHCVVRGLPLEAELTRSYGPLLESDPRFPKRSNVQFIEVVSRKELKLEIWERGAGYTLASGSSSCAAAAVAHRLGLVDDDLLVRMRGGDINIAFVDGTILMTGPVSKVYEGRFSPGFLAGLAGCPDA